VLREGPRDRPLYRVEFRLAGPDPRIALRRRRKVSDDERAEIDARAPHLAATMGRGTGPFKADVRKLKELGLTESLPVGYRLSPRGRAYYGYRGVARKRSRSR
jgi:hypothetical protein